MIGRTSLQGWQPILFSHVCVPMKSIKDSLTIQSCPMPVTTAEKFFPVRKRENI